MSQTKKECCGRRATTNSKRQTKNKTMADNRIDVESTFVTLRCVTAIFVMPFESIRRTTVNDGPLPTVAHH